MPFQPNVSRLQEEIGALVERFHLPGFGLGVVVGDVTVHTQGFGWADVAAKEPYAPEHRHRIGSITKTMVSLCVMALVDEGRMSLDDRVRDRLPDIPLHGHGDALLMRHLLSHTGGLGEAPNLEDLSKPFETLFYDSDPAVPLAQLYTNGLTVEAPPATKWAYANHGFALLGEIVSRAEKAPLAEVMRGRVFDRLGMKSSDIYDEPHADLATGYTQAETPEAWQLVRLMGIQLASEVPEDGHNMRGKYVRVWSNGAQGAVQSTVLDMCTYASALLRGSRGVVRPETLAEMTRPHWQPDARLPGWGLGFAARTVAGQRLFSHGGSVFGGWNSYLAVFPDLDAALVMHTNVMYDGFDTAVVPRVVAAFLDMPETPLPEREIDARVLATAPGVYELPSPGPLTNFRPLFNAGRIQLSAEDGALTMYARRGPWKSGVRLLPASDEPDFFTIYKEGSPPQYVVLLRDGDGAVTGLRFQQLCDYERNPEIQPWT